MSLPNHILGRLWCRDSNLLLGKRLAPGLRDGHVYEIRDLGLGVIELVDLGESAVGNADDYSFATVVETGEHLLTVAEREEQRRRGQVHSLPGRGAPAEDAANERDERDNQG